MFERLRGRHQSKDRIEGLSDAALHKAAIGGSGEAMGELYRRHGGLVYRFTLRMSRDASIAEEITQEVFLALLTQVGGLDRYDVARAALPTWLCGIARRQLWKHLGRFDDAVSGEDAPETESLEDSPATRLMRQEAVALVRQGLDELPPPLKEVIVLCELEEMSYEQTAQVLAIPIGTVRSRLHRAKARLAAALREEVASTGREMETK